MSLTEAKKYIDDLHKRQENPYLWPDFLTGLPDKAAILKKLEEFFPMIGEYTIVYIRIANVHPYLIKYGPDKHAAIIQWAAAILKTTAGKCPNSFVGALSTHDFIAMCRTKTVEKLFKSAGEMFRKKAVSFYSAEDRKRHSVMSYARADGTRVELGLMKLKAAIVNTKLPVKRSNLIMQMGRICEALEQSDRDVVVVTKEMLSRE